MMTMAERCGRQTNSVQTNAPQRFFLLQLPEP
jgi:hypothetical protein